MDATKTPIPASIPRRCSPHSNGTQVNDKGVAKLAGTKLETLQIANTKVTDKGVATLKTALPKLRVDR